MAYTYQNNSTSQGGMADHPEVEIDLKEIVYSVLKYKKSILAVTFLITIISAYFAYFQNNTYQAELTLEVQGDGVQESSNGDFLASAMGMKSSMGNTIVFLKSRYLAQKTLEKIQIGNRYFVKNRFRKQELYQDSPFIVKAEAIAKDLIGEEFRLQSVDQNRFRLSIEWIQSSTGKKVIYNHIHSYGTPLSTPYFRISVKKVVDLTNQEYFFSITPNEMMYSMIQSSLSAGLADDKASVLRLGYQDNVPQRAQDVLAAVAETFAEQNVIYNSSSAERTLKFIDEQLNGINKALQSSAANLRDFKSSHIMIDLGTKASAISNTMSQYETQKYEVELQESTLSNLLDYVKSNKELIGVDLGPVSGISAPISTLIGKLQEAYTYRSSISVDFTDKHPSMIKATEQIEALKKALSATIKSALRSLNERKSNIQKIIDSQKTDFESLPEQEKQLAQLNRSFLVNEKIYEYLLQKRAETSIIESSTASGVRIIDSSLVNPVPVQPHRTIIVLMGILGGLLLGIIQAFLRFVISNKVQTIGDIEQHTMIPLYCVLPLFKEKKSLYEDALRVLLTKFEFSTPRPKTITVSSSVRGEGRTTTALEFAKVVAQSGKKVVVLDMDMRSSSVNQKLAIENQIGMSTLLASKNTFDEVVRRTDNGIDVVVAGPLPTNPYELVMSERLQTLLNELKDRYDYILLESPPVGVVADALVLMRLSDLSLVVFKADYSKKVFIKNVNRFVDEHGLDNVGVILNGLELKKIRPWIKKK
ncbi:GumC family protein [Sulfuricurvum sp.]|uniref:GumC family protein n=1 Tax=Sulfuricurvum sp. TaxID=2025608 RepID=UPI00356222C6